MVGLGALVGMAIAAGVALVVSGWSPRPADPDSVVPRLARRRTEIASAQWVPAVVLAGAALVLTRWPIAAVGAGALGWFAGSWWAERQRLGEETKAEAVALWVEMLRDTIGTATGLAGAVQVTAAKAPAPIRPQVLRGAAGLRQGVPLVEVLDAIGTEIDHPVADLVVIAMTSAAETGGGRLGEVLQDLSESAHDQAALHRRLAVARAKPRAAMRYVALAVAVAVSLLVMLAPDYVEPYSTPAGQMVLVGVGALWAAGFVWMGRLSRVKVIDRIVRARP